MPWRIPPAALALTLTGCHLIFPFDPQPVDGAAFDASSPGPDSGQIDAPCAAKRWSAPVLLPGPVNSSTEDDWTPHLSPDQLTLYFKSWRAGLGQSDIWIATRPDLFSEFGEPVNLGAPVNSPCNEGGPSISTDGLTLFFSSKYQPDSNTCAADDDEIWFATRASPSGPFSDVFHVAELSSPSSDITPHLTADGLKLYFASGRGPGPGGYDIWVATRASPEASFTVELVPGVNSPSWDISPSLSPDGLQLYLASDRSGSLGKLDIWVAERADPQGAFGAPAPIPELNTPDDDAHPFIAADNHSLYFNRAANIMGDPNTRANIWISRLICLPGGD